MATVDSDVREGVAIAFGGLGAVAGTAFVMLLALGWAAALVCLVASAAGALAMLGAAIAAEARGGR